MYSPDNLKECEIVPKKNRLALLKSYEMSIGNKRLKIDQIEPLQPQACEVCVCVRACVRAGVCVCARACVGVCIGSSLCACVRASVAASKFSWTASCWCVRNISLYLFKMTCHPGSYEDVL